MCPLFGPCDGGGHSFLCIIRASLQSSRMLACRCGVQGLDVKVWRKYEEFAEELSERFPHEREGIKNFYGECWAVFKSLNSLELKSLEEPRYLLGGSHLLESCLCIILVMYIPMQPVQNSCISSDIMLGQYPPALHEYTLC